MNETKPQHDSEEEISLSNLITVLRTESSRIQQQAEAARLNLAVQVVLNEATQNFAMMEVEYYSLRNHYAELGKWEELTSLPSLNAWVKSRPITTGEELRVACRASAELRRRLCTYSANEPSADLTGDAYRIAFERVQGIFGELGFALKSEKPVSQTTEITKALRISFD